MKMLWLSSGQPPCEQPQSQDRREEDTSQAARQVLGCRSATKLESLASGAFICQAVL